MKKLKAMGLTKLLEKFEQQHDKAQKKPPTVTKL
jgi:hypothetical protein